MVHYKLILHNKRQQEKPCPIVVRITFNKNNTTLTTGIKVKPEHWDGEAQSIKKSHPNFQVLNKSVTEFYLKVQKIIHVLSDVNEFSFEALKVKLKGRSHHKVPSMRFCDFAHKLISEMLQINRSGNAIVYQTAVNRLVNYCGHNNITFPEITYSFLNDFKQKLILDGVRQNTVSNYFRSIRAIYNKAIKVKIVDRSLYPFLDISIKQEKTAKRALTTDHIKILTSAVAETGSPLFYAKNYFLLSFCLIGTSFTDLAYLKPDDIVDGRVMFKRRKTHKRYSIKVTKAAEDIILQYAGRNTKYLLPILPENITEDSFVPTPY